MSCSCLAYVSSAASVARLLVVAVQDGRGGQRGIDTHKTGRNLGVSLLIDQHPLR